MGTQNRWRRLVAAMAGTAMLAGGTAAAAVTPATGPAGSGLPATGQVSDKIDADLQEALDGDSRVDFWVRFADRPDLSELSGIGDWDARGQAVYDVLTDAARTSQAAAVSTLEEEGARYRSYWITNAIRVTGGTEELATTLARDDRVEGLYPTRTYAAPEPAPVELTDVGPAAVEWGIADINADDVWAEFGITGEDVVVANLDSGVQWDHPALIGQYRGWDGASADHDYNWFDGTPAGEPAPWDWDGHGTHTMGTMAGDDGGDNQIGVAPGVRWIAASTDLSDAMMFAAGEWLLAPTEIGGGNPDPAMRPHVINNSWGSGMPSNDPFMEDIIEAWHAAGQFSVFSNGNEGPGCATSGSPGSRVVTYSVGSYDPSHTISDFSSRGPGQDGEIKPDIAAPGDGVRSSVPGNGYDTYSGTSMAAPHVAGAVALLWASSPQLVGDIGLTRDLLDGTAVDTEDLQCGGTAENNNVFGEGRLDAHALVSAAPRGDTGYVEGVVTDAATGDPIPAAQVTLEGELERTVRTNPEGAYRALVSAGDYQVSAGKFGWTTQTETVTVPADGTVVQDFALQRSPSGTVSGTVTDGSGQGYPLYARVLVTGTDLFTYTDPADGSYSFEVPLGTPLRISVEVQYPGYTVVGDDLVLTGDLVHDVAVPVDALSCTAYGYEINVDGLTETFDDGTQPPGWSVEDYVGSGQVWVFDDPAGRGNLTGGEGGFAIVDSDWYGPEGVQNTALVSPSVDLTGQESPMLGFRQLYWPWDEVAEVDVSVDGGAEWTTVATFTGEQEGQTLLELPMAADEPDVRVRFHYYGASWALFWQVDDVFLGNRTCDPVGEGGYVFGNVSSSVQDAPIRGARVVSLENPADAGVTVDTPADENQDDGFYWLFSHEAGELPFEASARRYTSQVQDVTVPDEGSVRADFVLGGGLLTLDPTEIGTEVALGDSATEELTVTNEGDDVVDIELQEVRGDFELLRADGSRFTASQAREMAGAPDRRIDAPSSFAASPGRATGELPAAQGPAEEPWEMLTAYPTPVMDHRVVTLDGQWYVIGGTDGFEPFDTVRRYDPAGMEWVDLAPLPAPMQAVTAGVVDGQVVVSGGWTMDGSTTGATYVYDVGADEWSQVADNPSTVSAAGQAVLDGRLYSVGGCSTAECTPMSQTVTAYDPASDSWSELADYPEPVAFASCGGVAGQLYCTGGTSDMGDLSSTYAYDPAGDSWAEVAEAPVPWWASSSAVANGMLVVSGGVVMGDLSNETWGYDPAQDTWVDLPNPNTANYRGAASCGLVRVGGAVGFEPTDVVEYLPGFDDCGDVTDVPWLSLSQTEATLAPGESVTVEVTTDGTVPQPGDYTAGIRAVGGVPGSDPVTEVTMTVTPPATWGKLAGTVSGESCTGDLTPLGGATVDAAPTRMEQPRWRMVTDAEGQYARWIDTRVGELEMIAAADGHLPGSALVTPPRGEVTVQDFDLLHASCEVPPGPIHPDVFRIAGTDRYGTAAAVSQRFEPGVETVFVVTGRNYPDALAAAARAGSLGAPVLLTRPGSLPSATGVELRRLEPQEVVVVGGTEAVHDRVLDAIDVVTDAQIRRVTGSNRYATAANLAAEFDTADTVFVATGLDYPDALAGASRAGALDAPVLLVRTESVPAATRQQLDRLAPEQIVLLGGELAVSTGVEEALGEYGSVTRVAGTDRYRTAAAVAAAYPTADTTYVASGQNWPDALAGAALAGRDGMPMLLVRQDSVPGATWGSLERLEPGRVPVLGGPVAVADTVLDQLRTLECAHPTGRPGDPRGHRADPGPGCPTTAPVGPLSWPPSPPRLSRNGHRCPDRDSDRGGREMGMQSAWWRAAAGLTVGVVLACGMAASALPAPADEETTGGAGDSGGRMPSVAAFPGDGPGPAPVRARDRQAPAETPFPVVEGRWKPLANYPTRIVDHEVVLVDDTWYAVGGSDGWQSDATVRAYDPVGRAWRSVADLPAPRHAAAVAAVEGGIVVSGGWTPEADTAVETYTYDTGSDTWSQGADNPFAAVSAAGTAVLDGRLYSVGGCTTGACLPVSALVTVYDPSTDSWARLADYPLGVAFPSCGGIDGRVYCSGGVTDLDETSQEATARSFVYDPTDDTWSPVADAPAPTWAAADTVAIGMLFTVGGVVDGVPSAKARSYDPGTDTWVDQPDLPFAVHRGAAACGLVQVGGVFLEPIDTAWFLPGYDGCPGGAVALMADRISGADRYGTAAAVSQRFGPGVETVFVVTGRNYPDALAAAARAGSLGAPVLLTRPGSLPGATSRELSVRDPEEVVVVGGTEAVHDRVLEAIEEVVDARVRRIAGGDRYATAADVAAEFDTADTVFVATGLDYPDALAGASRAGALDAPVLLVRTDSVPAATRRELERLRPDRIVLLGGPVAVTTGVEEELGGYGSVTRVAGTDRYRTAAALAGAFPAADSVYAASGQNWPDALAGAALAGHEQAPILLVRQASLPGPTRRALERLEPGWVGVVGGPVAVGEQVLAELRELR